MSQARRPPSPSSHSCSLALTPGTATSPASHSRRKPSNWPTSKKKCSDSRSSGVAPLTTEWGDLSSVGEYVAPQRSEAHTSELQSLMHILYAVVGLKKKN